AASGLERGAEAAANSVEGAGPVQVSGASVPAVARDSGPPTYGNLLDDAPDPRGEGRRVQLVKDESKDRWYEVWPDGTRRTARGEYDFVVRGGKIWAVKGSRAIGQLNPGHKEAAGTAAAPGATPPGPFVAQSTTNRVEFAGTIRFKSGPNSRGELKTWSNVSGHVAPVSAFATEVGKRVGLPAEKFQPIQGEKPEKGPQLPVAQPGPGDIFVPKAKGSPPAGEEPATPGRSEALQRPEADPAGPRQRSSTSGRPPTGRISPPGVPARGTFGRKALVAFEASKIVLGWAGELIQEAEPRKALMHIEPEVNGKLFRNPGYGVVIVLTWSRPIPRGTAADVGHTKGPWVFQGVETFAREEGHLRDVYKQGVHIESDYYSERRKQYFWVPPIPKSELPPEESRARPESMPLPNVDQMGIHIAAKRLLETGEKLVGKRGAPASEAEFNAWLDEKNRWNRRIEREIAALSGKWDAVERRKLTQLADWFNEEASKILQQRVGIRSGERSRFPR